MPDIGTLLQVKENQFFRLKCISGLVHPSGEYIVINGVLYQNGKRRALKVSSAILADPSDFIVQLSLDV